MLPEFFLVKIAVKLSVFLFITYNFAVNLKDFKNLKNKM